MSTHCMTPRDRWLAMLRRERPDRMPMDYRATDEATRKIMAHLGCATRQEMYTRLHIDPIVTVHPRYVGPTLAPDENMYGCRFQDISYGEGVYAECIYHPLAGYNSIEAVEEHYTWPTADWFDYADVPAQVQGKDEYPVQGGGSEPFLTYKELRGMEQAYVDLALQPEFVHYCLDKLFAFCYENTRRIYEQIPGRVNITYVAEDLGSQESLLLSRQMILEFLLPRMKHMIDLVHEAGAYVFFHSDGAIRPILDDFIAAGIDVLNPVQWRCAGMERRALKEDFGDRVVFLGAMDNQYTLPFGTVEDVREEVIYNIQILGAGGGYILAPCHNIQVVGPAENVVVMYDTGYEYGTM